MKSLFFMYVAEFTNIAANSQEDANVATDTDSDFVCDEIQPEFQLNGAYLSAIDGTPLPNQQQNISGSSQVLPTLAHVRLSIQQGGNQWQKNVNGVRASALKKLSAAYLLSKPVIPANETLQVRAYNDGPAPIKGQVVFIGRKVDKGRGQIAAAA